MFTERPVPGTAGPDWTLLMGSLPTVREAEVTPMIIKWEGAITWA